MTYSKIFILVSFIFTLSISATKVSIKGVLNGDNSELDEATIKKEGENKLYHYNPNAKKIENVEKYPRSFNYLLGKSREWSNFQRSKQLKRSEDLTANSLPYSSINNESADTVTNNSMSKYHCPINLLHGNNLTVKNYFLVIPRNNDNFNETLQRIALLGEESCEPKTTKTNEEFTPTKTVTEGENISLKHSFSTLNTLDQTTSQALFDSFTKTESTLSKSSTDSEHLFSENATVILLNSSESDSTSTANTLKNESSLSLSGEEEKMVTTPKSLASVTISGEASEHHTSQATSIPSPSTEVNEFLRTVDKYCETFNTHPGLAPTPATALYYNFNPPVEHLKRLNRESKFKNFKKNIN